MALLAYRLNLHVDALYVNKRLSIQDMNKKIPRLHVFIIGNKRAINTINNRGEESE